MGTTEVARRLALKLLPPVVVDAVRAVRGKSTRPSSFTYSPGGWPTDDPTIRGWDHQSVAETQGNGWQRFADQLRSGSPLVGTGIDPASPAALSVHNTYMTYAYVLGAASVGKDQISVLDWGCGLGQYGLIAQELYSELRIDFHCRELPTLSARGRQLSPTATFHDDDASALRGPYDLVVASGSLQYFEDWRGLLQALAAASNHYVFVTRLPVVPRSDSFVVLQRPGSTGYQTEYPGWHLNRGEFIRAANQSGLALRREFLVAEASFVERAPEQAEHRGFLFSRNELPR
jgi:putative methyltransferase (TIGR04325 family)